MLHDCPKHRQSRVATKVVRKTTAVKQGGETWSKVRMTGRLRHSGHTQSPLSSAFPIIILARVIHVHSTSAERPSAQWLFFPHQHQNCGCGEHHSASALASSLHGMKLQYRLSALGLLRNWQILCNYPIYSQSGGAGVWTLQGQ